MKEKEDVKNKLKFTDISKLVRKANRGRRNSVRSATTSTFRDLALQAGSKMRRNTRSKYHGDKEKVPISDEQIENMIIKIKRRRIQQEEFEEEPKTYEEKIQKTKFTRSTQKY